MARRWRYDHGVRGNWGKEAAKALAKAIQALVGKAMPIQGTYRTRAGFVSGTYWYDAATNLFFFVDETNNVLGGWKLNDRQQRDLFCKRTVF